MMKYKLFFGLIFYILLSNLNVVQSAHKIYFHELTEDQIASHEDVLSSLNKHMRRLLNNDDSDGIEVVTDHEFNDGTILTKMQQKYKNIEVFGSTFVVKNLGDHYDAPFHGVYVKGIGQDLIQTEGENFNPLPQLEDKQVLDIIRKKHSHDQNWRLSNKKVKHIIFLDKNDQAHKGYIGSYMAETETNFTRPMCLIKERNGVPYKCWEALDTSHLDNPRDAQGPGGNLKTGRYEYGMDFGYLKVDQYCNYQTTYVQTYNNFHTTSYSELFKVKDCPPSLNDIPTNTFQYTNGAYSPLNDAHFFAHVVWKMYVEYTNLTVLPFPIRSQVHYGYQVENAFWDGSFLKFGDGRSTFYPLVGLDIVGHEAAHGFTEHHSNLIYSGQSGGMNEAYSDMAGEASKYFMHGTNNFAVGSDIKKGPGALRYMYDPPLDGRSIDHVSAYANQDVHFTSGIFNKVFYVLATTPGWNTQSAFHVFTIANEMFWSRSATFESASCGVFQAAQNLGYNSMDVFKAFQVVGLDPCVFTPPIPRHAVWDPSLSDYTKINLKCRSPGCTDYGSILMLSECDTDNSTDNIWVNIKFKETDFSSSFEYLDVRILSNWYRCYGNRDCNGDNYIPCVHNGLINLDFDLNSSNSSIYIPVSAMISYQVNYCETQNGDLLDAVIELSCSPKILTPSPTRKPTTGSPTRAPIPSPPIITYWDASNDSSAQIVLACPVPGCGRQGKFIVNGECPSRQIFITVLYKLGDYGSPFEYLTVEIAQLNNETYSYICGTQECPSDPNYAICAFNQLSNLNPMLEINVQAFITSAVNVCPTDEGNYMDTLIRLSCMPEDTPPPTKPPTQFEPDVVQWDPNTQNVASIKLRCSVPGCGQSGFFHLLSMCPKHFIYALVEYRETNFYYDDEYLDVYIGENNNYIECGENNCRQYDYTTCAEDVEVSGALNNNYMIPVFAHISDAVDFCRYGPWLLAVNIHLSCQPFSHQNLNFVPHPMKFEAAQMYCEKHYDDGDLTSIIKFSENRQLIEFLSMYAIHGKIQAWIGGYQPNANHNSPNHGWKWTDGSEWDFTDWAWSRPRRNDRHMDCLMVDVSHNMTANTWKDKRCPKKLPFVCTGELKTKPPMTTEKPGPNWKLITKKMDWYHAREYCYNHNHGRLLSIHNHEMDEKVTDYLVYECKGRTECKSIWLGGYQTNAERKMPKEGWRWSDGTYWDYTNWRPRRPREDRRDMDCLVLHSTRPRGRPPKTGWADKQCFAPKSFICSWEPLPPPPPKHFIAYGMYLYATLTMADPNGTTPGCDANEFHPLPYGWELVPGNDTDSMQVAEMHPWSTYFLSVGFPSMSGVYGQTWLATKYSVGNCYGCFVVKKWYSHPYEFRSSTCNVRVFIRRMNPFYNTVKFGDNYYATITFANPMGTDPGCDANSFTELRPDWYIVPQNDTDAMDVAEMFPWSTQFLTIGYPSMSGVFGQTWLSTSWVSPIPCLGCYVIKETDEMKFKSSGCIERVFIRMPINPLPPIKPASTTMHPYTTESSQMPEMTTTMNPY